MRSCMLRVRNSGHDIFEPSARVFTLTHIGDELLPACGGFERIGALPTIRPVMVRQANLAEPWRDTPTADGTSRPGQA